MRALAAALMACLALLLAAPGSAAARESIDVDAVCSLLVKNAPVDVAGGVELSLYKVADVGAAGGYVPCAAFAGYPVDFAPSAESDWRALAQTLSAYAARDGIVPDTAGTTSQAGTLRFSA